MQIVWHSLKSEVGPDSIYRANLCRALKIPIFEKYQHSAILSRNIINDVSNFLCTSQQNTTSKPGHIKSVQDLSVNSINNFIDQSDQHKKRS
jgi:hypothetical protein